MSRVKILVLGAVITMVLTGCDLWNKYLGREDVAMGNYVTIEYTGPGSAQWTFTAFPDSSHLTAADILPADTNNVISFKPDVEGKYDIQLSALVNGKVKTKNYYYSVELPESGELAVGEIPDHLKSYLNARDTLDSLGLRNTSSASDSNPRSYLDKVVTPEEYASQQKAPAPKPAVKPKKITKPAVTPKKTASSHRATSTKNRGNMVPRANKSFTIQISSWESLEDAQAEVKKLRNTYGLEAYIQRAFFKDTDQVFYRVRVGNYKTYSAAEKAAKNLKQTTNIPVWVDYVRQEM